MPEMSQRKKAAMQVTSVYAFAFLSVLLLACSVSKRLTSGNDRFEVQKLKSKNGGSYITIGTYHYEDKSERAPAVFYINKVIYDQKVKLIDTTFSVLPGQYNINVRYVLKEDTEINALQVQKGDSVYLKVYLKNDTSPLHDISKENQ